MENPVDSGKLPSSNLTVTSLTRFTMASRPVKVLNKQGFQLSNLEMVLLQDEFNPPIQNRVYNEWHR